ncbi:MAG: DUF3516 domain-containing protein, partial [Myxococcota bacterium]
PPAREEEVETISAGVTRDTRAFTVLVRNAAFRTVRRLAQRNYEAALGELVEPADKNRDPWTPQSLETALAPYFEEHGEIRTDPTARRNDYFLVDRHDDHWQIRQRLVDPEAHADWVLVLRIDLEASDEAGRPTLDLISIGT